ncbi:Uncharacterized protein Adt_23719 [Abeliophyllum distichum]|uniref:Uncharacterized protein n=1 Tax=Abeliophyllum distichum TaxID=126358 RepID=A0ABD1SBN3_9LAMI
MEFLVVDTHSTYHGVLGRPALKDLQAVTSIHHLVMKFPTPGRIAKGQGNQTKAMVFYMNTLQKVAMRESSLTVVMTIHVEAMDVDQEKGKEEMVLNEGLDP